MKALIQRVSSSQVKVDGKLVGSVEKGLLVFLGFEKQDTRSMADKMINKIISYRLFPDQNQKNELKSQGHQWGNLNYFSVYFGCGYKKMEPELDFQLPCPLWMQRVFTTTL